jgi:hypothetical protein
VREQVEFILVDTVDEVWAAALEDGSVPDSQADGKVGGKSRGKAKSKKRAGVGSEPDCSPLGRWPITVDGQITLRVDIHLQK